MIVLDYLEDPGRRKGLLSTRNVILSQSPFASQIHKSRDERWLLNYGLYRTRHMLAKNSTIQPCRKPCTPRLEATMFAGETVFEDGEHTGALPG